GLGKTELDSGTLHLPAYRAVYLDSLFREDAGVSFSRDRDFKSMVRELKETEEADAKLPEHLEGTLRDYQKKGYAWLKTLDHYGFGGILADDMGLGKTIQILALLSSVYEEKEDELPSLVVCPASLVYNWGHECAMFAPSLKVLLATGTMEERRTLLENASEYDVIVTSYDLLRRDFACYQDMEFRFQIIDEAQYIKNASTQNARAAKAIRAVSRFALTGTPVENRLSELWSIFDFLMPGFLFSYRKFKSSFELPIARDEDSVVLERLHRMIRPFVLRRLKSDVLKELPEKLEKVVYSAAEGRQKTLYQAAALKLKLQLEAQDETAESSGREKLEILSQLTILRQLCCDPSLCFENYAGGSAKLETCISLISSAVEAGHKLLLFSQFASMLEILAKRLEKEGIRFHLLTGATPKEERNRMVSAFSKDEVPVFLISLKAGGTGLNLTAADIVIHYDPWWNVAAQNQATDRAHRIGQKRQVTVYKLIMKHTIEENILRLQESKQQLADQIVREGMVSLGNLSREELLKLFG
ncbi:MAG: DEAD/DEAH box helicase, partial [Clostridium sp.]|nr:DEAD/DEAH box helicase [Clostridium sp.]